MAKRSPPIPQPVGSIRPSAALAAIAASTAVPPIFRMSRAICVASGWLVAAMKLPPFIVTLGMMTVARGLALVECIERGGQRVAPLADQDAASGVLPVRVGRVEGSGVGIIAVHPEDLRPGLLEALALRRKQRNCRGRRRRRRARARAIRESR